MRYLDFEGLLEVSLDGGSLWFRSSLDLFMKNFGFCLAPVGGSAQVGLSLWSSKAMAPNSGS